MIKGHDHRETLEMSKHCRWKSGETEYWWAWKGVYVFERYESYDDNVRYGYWERTSITSASTVPD